MTHVYKGSVGVTFEVDTQTDLTDATKVSIIVQKPSKSTSEWEAVVGDDPSDGILTYVSKEGDLDENGFYYIQSYVEFDDQIFYGQSVKIKVYDTYEIVALY